MIKAIFFDLYHTLVRYEPPREELLATTLKDFGINVDAGVLQEPLVSADEFIYREMSVRPLSQRSQEEKMALYIRHHEIVFQEAGIEVDQGTILHVLGKMQGYNMNLVLFDDVAPALDDLKGRGLQLGLISNVEEDITDMLNRLNLTSWLKIVVTSQAAEASKPSPKIFQEAIRQAGIQPPEAIYVGDQYQVDIVGASTAGLKGILIDRLDHHREISDYPRILSLTELPGYL